MKKAIINGIVNGIYLSIVTTTFITAMRLMDLHIALVIGTTEELQSSQCDERAR